MTSLQPPVNIKVCPECGTNLISNARHCAVCGYRFTDNDLEPIKSVEYKPIRTAADPYIPPRMARRPANSMQVMINLPILFVGIILLLAINTLLVLGLQKRDETKNLVASEKATATFIATTYVSPTPTITLTSTPAPPTETPVVDIEYTVVAGDSCLSIAKRYNLYLDSLLAKNDIDCGVLAVGTVLRIPHPTRTPEPTNTLPGK